MASIEQLNRLKQQAERTKAEADRAEGALAQLMETLRAKYGCNSLAEAEAKLAKLQRKAAASEQTFDEALANFERTYHGTPTAESAGA